jgi:hypothetical protein
MLGRTVTCRKASAQPRRSFSTGGGTWSRIVSVELVGPRRAPCDRVERQGRPENRRHERRAAHQVASRRSAPIMNSMPLEWAPGEAATLHRRRNAKPAGALCNRHVGEPGRTWHSRGGDFRIALPVGDRLAFSFGLPKSFPRAQTGCLPDQPPPRRGLCRRNQLCGRDISFRRLTPRRSISARTSNPLFFAYLIERTPIRMGPRRPILSRNGEIHGHRTPKSTVYRHRSLGTG